MEFHVSRLFKARDKPRNALNGSGYSFLFGNTVAGKALRHPLLPDRMSVGRDARGRIYYTPARTRM